MSRKRKPQTPRCWQCRIDLDDANRHQRRTVNGRSRLLCAACRDNLDRERRTVAAKDIISNPIDTRQEERAGRTYAVTVLKPRRVPKRAR